ncbi:TatD family hydrolase [Alcanivorax sp. 1008]|uniref:TatD family hydrolase n=1 Tax=Alcanivorax sp. 1008 TaxID=2816853 RepID=UPI001E174F68|nr:TatD family hydrolase [Alcanivorax sp. 1008]
MLLADIGVNLTDKRFSQDRSEVLQRAREAGVVLQVLTGTSVPSSAAALQLAETEPDLFCTAGIHPHQASEFSASSLKDLRQLASHSKVRAIGETGLDFNRDFSPRPQQENAFIEQLALAAELQLPAFLHQRDAHHRFLPIVREARDQLCDLVVHCFTGSREELFDYLDLDCHIGITGWICDERRGMELQRLAGNIPADRLLIETDAPWLLPRNMDHKPPVSGRNEPALLPWIVRQLAQSTGRTEQSIGQQSWQNAKRFFRIST